MRAEPVLALEHEHAAAAQRERPRRRPGPTIEVRPPTTAHGPSGLNAHQSSRSSAAPTTDSASIWWCS